MCFGNYVSDRESLEIPAECEKPDCITHSLVIIRSTQISEKNFQWKVEVHIPKLEWDFNGWSVLVRFSNIDQVGQFRIEFENLDFANIWVFTRNSDFRPIFRFLVRNRNLGQNLI